MTTAAAPKPGSPTWKSLRKDLAIDLAINGLGWAAASALQTDKFFDLLGGVAHIAMILRHAIPRLLAARHSKAEHATSAGAAARSPRMHPRQVLGSAAAMLWAVRLSGYLFSRNVASGMDKRFVKAVKMPLVFGQFWLFQASWAFLNLLPLLVSNSKTGEELRDKPLNRWD